MSLATLNLVYQVQGPNRAEAWTDSLKVAEFFDREHRDVLRALRELECSEYFRARNFREAAYDVTNATGTYSEVMYEMSKDGFSFLVMGFTGKKAAEFKEAYIESFNNMAASIEATRAAELAQPLIKVAIEYERKAFERREFERRTSVQEGPLKQGLTEQQWADIREYMRDISNEADDAGKAFNAVETHFLKRYRDKDLLIYNEVLSYLAKMAKYYENGYVPVYRRGSLVIDDRMI